MVHKELKYWCNRCAGTVIALYIGHWGVKLIIVAVAWWLV